MLATNYGISVGIGLVVGVLVGFLIGRAKGRPGLGALLGIFGCIGWIIIAVLPRQGSGGPGPS